MPLGCDDPQMLVELRELGSQYSGYHLQNDGMEMNPDNKDILRGNEGGTRQVSRW